MSTRQFEVSDNYHGLQEAVDAIMAEEDSDVEFDIVALPPEPSILTDEEEGDEDNIFTNDMPRDIPGNVQVFVNRDEEDWDSSDEEPLSNSARMQRCNVGPLDEDCNVPVVSKAMTRNRFLDIKKYLHFCDNTVAAETSDKMFKVRTLAKVLMKKFIQWGVFHTNLSIDESMVKSSSIETIYSR